MVFRSSDNNLLNKPVEERFFKRCSAYGTAVTYNLPLLLTFFERKEIKHTFFRSGKVVHRAYSFGDIFYFSYGTVVLWGLSKSEEQEILDELHGFEETTIDPPEVEESRYSVGKSAKILKDDITIPEDTVLTKLAFSHGLAQSVKLSIFEKRIERRIEMSRYAPESLAKLGRIPLSRKQLTRIMGELFLERNMVNLHTDVLESPEFFWEYSDLEPLYRLIAQDLDISSRVTVLNKRLDIVKELFEMLANELDRRYSGRLELSIVVLIFIEVFIVVSKEIMQLIFG